MQKPKKIILALSIAFMSSLILTIAFGLTTWNRGFSGLISDSSFIVQSPLGTEIPSGVTVALDIVNNGTVYNYDYYVLNNGNVPITVTVNDITPVNCIISWNTDTNIIPIGGNILYQLTLTINGTAGSTVSYSFTFDKV